MSDLIELRDGMRRFTEERDWAKYHDPKSLIMALVSEVGELAELFQWLPAEAALETAREEPLHRRVEEEISDVLLYLIRLADVLDVDLAEAAARKMQSSAAKHQPGQQPTRFILPE
ncbi:nucleotide pyrophosphohydrolase [Microlunatus sp. Gsoil 973]|uniref:nucleotide pyrophosphohydrolase n=1 Tax=Microlunatus sp. Gsoil 973 TaxID=2672569 RepID=UPI001E39D045|nr:nucleotide pyrophosphohydrolase [Microlunatus sp. Gsoil 973]